jgi:hypothetical protein
LDFMQVTMNGGMGLDTYQGLASDLQSFGAFHNGMGCILARVNDRPDDDISSRHEVMKP